MTDQPIAWSQRHLLVPRPSHPCSINALMYPSEEQIAMWYAARDVIPIDTIIASNPNRYPRLRWEHGTFDWGGTPIPAVYCFAGELDLGHYTTLPDQVRVGVSHLPASRMPPADVANWCNNHGTMPFDYDREHPTALVEHRVTLAFYDFLDSLHEPFVPYAERIALFTPHD